MQTSEAPVAGGMELGGVSFEDLVRELLLRVGEDPTRPGLVRTPERSPTERSCRSKAARTPGSAYPKRPDWLPGKSQASNAKTVAPAPRRAPSAR